MIVPQEAIHQCQNFGNHPGESLFLLTNGECISEIKTVCARYACVPYEIQILRVAMYLYTRYKLYVVAKTQSLGTPKASSHC